MTGAEASTYLGMFGTAFGAATLLPMQSELVLAGLVASGRYPIVWLFLAATAGNVLGSCLNWWIGRQVERFRDRRWFPVKPEILDRAITWYHRYGRWSLLFSWVPVVGDPLTVVAGMLREPWWSFLMIVTIAKAARYLVIVQFATQWV